jgi:hypothetical protein
MDGMDDLDLSIDGDFEDEVNAGFDLNLDDDGLTQKPLSKSIKTKDRQVFKRLTSERQLEELLEWEFEPDTAYHVISGGDIDALSFLKYILRQQSLEYVAFSTWCMAECDILEIMRYLQLGRITRIDGYVGEIFKGTYYKEYEMLLSLHKTYGGRTAIFRNHAKIFIGFGKKFDFVIETSANINTNPRSENTVITTNTALALFYKDFYDGVRSFERDFDDWKPYKLSREQA